MIFDTVRPLGEDRDKSLPSRPEPEDSPPTYSQAAQTASVSPRTLSVSRNRQTVVPFTAPVNGLNMFTKRDAIRGSWSLDPLAPQVPAPGLVQTFLDGQAGKKKCRRSRSSKTMPPTAKLATRHAGIHALFRVLGNSIPRSIARIHAESRSGNIVLDLVSISPTRTVHIDAHSRKGSVTLLVPRGYSGLVQLYSRHGMMELLPALKASARVINTKNKETTVLVGDGPMPELGTNSITDTARIRSRHGRVRLGYSGEDYFTEPPKLMDQAIQFVQKIIVPSLQKAISK